MISLLPRLLFYKGRGGYLRPLMGQPDTWDEGRKPRRHTVGEKSSLDGRCVALAVKL